MGKTSYISSNYAFTRLIHQGDNSNKKTLIYIPHILCRHYLSSYNLSCLKVTELECVKSNHCAA